MAAVARTSLEALVLFCKRRGFVFQSAEIYNGIKGCFDYGPLGIELKRNIANEWWRSMVHQRDDVVGVDTAIMSPRELWAASGHLELFNDRLADCLLSRDRFRADKAPLPNIGKDKRMCIRAPNPATATEWVERIRTMHAPGAAVERHGNDVILTCLEVHEPNESREGTLLLLAEDASSAPISIPYVGYVCPATNSPFVGKEWLFNAMFRTAMGAVDPVGAAVEAAIANRDKSPEEIRAAAAKAAAGGAVYLRPETAQGIFTQFLNVVNSTGRRPPFGIAQVGKAFRNEFSVEHFVFRSREFEQMEMEYFCDGGSGMRHMEFWTAERLSWWKTLLRHGDTRLRLVQHENKDLAHYARACTDIEFDFPFGWGELEGIAWRGDFDLRAHSKHSGARLCVPGGVDGEQDGSWTPHVIEPSAGLTRGFLAVLCDAFYADGSHVIHGTSGASGDNAAKSSGSALPRALLSLHPRLAPVKAAVLPLVKKDAQFMERAHVVHKALRKAGLPSQLSETGSVGRRYVAQDEIGTPCCITIDKTTLDDGTVTVRDRDTAEQRRIKMDDVVDHVSRLIA